ncbi:MAG: hypothetical protein AB7U41_01755 [Dongiaceae bacterium]
MKLSNYSSGLMNDYNGPETLKGGETVLQGILRRGRIENVQAVLTFARRFNLWAHGDVRQDLYEAARWNTQDHHAALKMLLGEIKNQFLGQPLAARDDAWREQLTQFAKEVTKLAEFYNYKDVREFERHLQSQLPGAMSGRQQKPRKTIPRRSIRPQPVHSR